MTESKTFDFKISVIFPFVTKDLKDKDSTRINATGAFNFRSRPQVDTAVGPIISSDHKRIPTNAEEVTTLKKNFDTMLADISRIEVAMERKAKHITLTYDPELSENEALTDTEESIFGVASGRVTFPMYKQVLEFENRIDKYISHQSIENKGVLSAGS